MRGTREERFWSKVDKRRTDECWAWLGYRCPKGYGRFRDLGGVTRPHRTSWELTHGEPLGGREIDHTCHNRACVNPKHLQVVTRKQNVENISGPKRTNTSGYRGVFPVRNKWRAQVNHNYKRIHVGYFDTPEEAASAAAAKRRELFTNSLMDKEIPA